LRTINIQMANRIFGILSRAMLLHFALPRDKVNNYIYIFDLYIQSQREMSRRSQFTNSSASVDNNSSNSTDNSKGDVTIFDDNQENNYILSPLFTYNYKLIHNGKSARVVKGTMKDTRTKWDSIVSSYDSDIKTCEFCSGCLLRIQLAAEGNSKKKSPKEIYALVKRNLFDLAHTMQWRRTVGGEQPQPSTLDMNFDFILSNIYNSNTPEGDALDNKSNLVHLENLLRLVYVVHVENFIMIYSPQSGCRSIAMLSEVDPPEVTMRQRKRSIQVDMNNLENDDSIHVSFEKENRSNTEDNDYKLESNNGKKQAFNISLMNDVPHENINYIRFPTETQNIIVDMVQKQSDAHKRDTSGQSSRKRMPAIAKSGIDGTTPTSSRHTLINTVEGLHLKKIARTVIENAEGYQKVHSIPIKGNMNEDLPTEAEKIGFFASMFSRRVVVPRELRSLRKHEAPLLFVSSPVLMFLPYEDILIDVCDVTRSHSVIFPFKCNIENGKRQFLSKKAYKSNRNNPKRPNDNKEDGNNNNNVLSTVDMKIKSIYYGKSIKIPQFLSIAYKTRRPVLQQTNEKVRKTILIRRLMNKINHQTTKLTGGKHHPMNPNPNDVDHLKFHEKRLFSSSAYFYSFINRRYAAHCDNVPFQTPLLKYGEYPRENMFNNGSNIKKLFNFIHVQYRVTSASAILSWFESFSDNNGKRPIILVLTFADMLECSEILYHIIGFRPDICIMFAPAESIQVVLTMFTDVFSWAKKAIDRDIILLKNAMKKPKQTTESKPYLGDKEGPLNKQDVPFNLPEEWRTIRSIILSTTRVLRVQYDVNVTVLNLPS
jgi:hypothetical protein